MIFQRRDLQSAVLFQDCREHIRNYCKFSYSPMVQILAYKLKTRMTERKIFVSHFPYWYLRAVIENKVIYFYASFYWKLKELGIIASDSVVIKSLCGEPDPRPIKKFTDGSPVHSTAAQVSHRCERKGGGDEVWGYRRLICGQCCKIHPSLFWRGGTRAGECYTPTTAPFILPELALENLNFINQLGQLVEGSDGPPSGNTGFRNPAQKKELPNHNMRGH